MADENGSNSNRSLEMCRRVVTTESFIKEAKQVWGDRYDYSKVDYKNREHRVTVICPIHGEFQVYAREHLDGKGCPKCEKGEKFISKLKAKFGDKFGLEKFVYQSSTSPVTLICPKHGEFTRLPNSILNSANGCPECGKEALQKRQENLHNIALDKKKAIKAAKEEQAKKDLENWEKEHFGKIKMLKHSLDSFREGNKQDYASNSFNIYEQLVDEHIDDIRYSAKWREPYRAPYRISQDEAKKYEFYREGDSYYRYPNEAPTDLILNAFKEFHPWESRTMADYMSHRSCKIHFVGNDLVIQEESYEPHTESNTSKNQVSEDHLPSSFVSIDFETLYAQRLSACSVGMVKYKDGEIVDKFYSLIKPPFDYPDKKGRELTWIHGITKEMLMDQKTFPEILPSIENFVDGFPLVAHNSTVESGCIRDNCTYYNIKTNLDYKNIYDTLKLAKVAEKKLNILEEGQGTHTLDKVCERFGIEPMNHHNALDDAVMCGNLMVAFYMILVEGKSMEELTTINNVNKPIPINDSTQTTNTSTEHKIQKEQQRNGCLGLLIFFAIIISFLM